MKVTGTGPSSNDRVRESINSEKAGALGSTEKRRSGRSENGGEPAEKVAISNRARDIAKAREAAKSAPDIDEAKVAGFKSAIQNGTYKVDADKVADRMVDEQLATM